MQGFLLHQVAFLLDIKISSAVAAAAYSLFVGVSAVGRLGMGFLGIRYPTKPLAILCHAFADFGNGDYLVGEDTADDFSLQLPRRVRLWVARMWR